MCRITSPPVAVASMTIALLCGGALALPGALAAQGEEEETGIHVVREGETLEGIAAYYLGSAARWREIWQDNRADIANPDLIYPGYKLKVPVPEKLPERAAVVAMLARRVEDLRQPLPSEPALLYDFLQPLDVLQTYEASSAELRFANETSLFVTEQSRVVLGAPPAAARDRQKIEIVTGQADLESRPQAGAAPDVEIVMGHAVLTPRPGAAGDAVQARTRRPQGQGAQVMVYEGEGDVAAAGATVSVARGMGTTVAEKAAPGPPEKLLDAPRGIAPEPGSRWDVPNPTFEWEPVAGARAYTLEVCRDPKCGALELRATGLTVTAWREASLPVAGYYWRVTASSPSGLDGYPSAPAAFSVGAAVAAVGPADRAAPRTAFTFAGPQVGLGESLVVGVGAEIRAEITDEESGVASWARLLDGEEVTEAGWRAPWSPGAHSAAVRAVDRAGNGTTQAAPFVYDPEPPVISWGLEDGQPLGETSGVSGPEVAPLAEKQKRGFWARTSGSDRSPLVWTSSELKWLPMGYGAWKISSDKPFILLRARKRPISLPAIGQRVTRDRGLWIHAVDPGCGVERMTYQLLVEPNGRQVLVVEAVDALDNRSRAVWPLVRD